MSSVLVHEMGHIVDTGLKTGNSWTGNSEFMDGELPINPSGGVLSTNCIGATGLIRIGEAALQVMGKADKKQIPGAKVALATGFGGCCWSDVTILSSKPHLD